MTPESYVVVVDTTLRQLADASAASRMRAYLLDQFEFLGISAPLRRKAVQAATQHRWTSPAEVLDVTHRLWRKPEREFRYTAVDVLKYITLEILNLGRPALEQCMQDDFLEARYQRGIQLHRENKYSLQLS